MGQLIEDAGQKTSVSRSKGVVSPTRSRSRRWLELAVLVLALVALVWAIQTGAGAYQAGFGAYPDEPSHFASAVLIHDYITAPLHASPLAHAKSYYIYRPFFAVGYWPPLFYLLEGLWMLILGVGRSQAIAFVLVELVLLAVSVALVARRYAGKWTGLALAALLCLLPIMQWSSCVVMTDLTVAMFAFWATINLAAYFDRDTRKSAIAFAVFAACALLSKYSAGFLAFLPVVAVLAMWRLDLLRKATFWLQPLVVALIVGPWLWSTWRMMNLSFAEFVPEPFPVRVRTLSVALWSDLSGPLCIVLLVAWIFCISQWRRLTDGDRVLLLQPLVIAAFLVFDPTGLELRHFLPAFPCLLLAVPMAVNLLNLRIDAPLFRWVAPTFCALVVLYGFWSWQRFQPLPGQETRAAARWLSANLDLENSAMLLPTNLEGPMIAEFAIIERDRAHHILVRPTKFMAREDWLGIRYEPLFHNTNDLSDALRLSPLRAVVTATDCQPIWPHDQLLNQVLNDPNSGWQPSGTLPGPHGCSFRLYLHPRAADHDMRPAFAYFERQLHREINRF